MVAPVYLGGRGKQGATVALRAPPLHLPIVSSSGAALASLALRLGGRHALHLLLSREYVQLLKGFGTSDERLRLASSWLARMRVPLDAVLPDLSRLACLPFAVVLYCARSQIPRFVCTHGGLVEGASFRLPVLVAALCSLVPIPGPSRALLLDAEHVIPMECLAGAVTPPPLFVFGPSEPSLRGLRSLEFSVLLASFNERLLTQGGRLRGALPIFRTSVPHLLETMLSGDDEALSSVGWALPQAATLIVYLVACVLRACAAQPWASAQDVRAWAGGGRLL